MSRQGMMRGAERLYYGVAVGLVKDNADPEQQGRVKLAFPWFSDSLVSEWCRVCQPYAGNGYGFYWVPEVDDEVLVAFVHGDMLQPIVLGGLYNGVDKPARARNGGDPKVIHTRAGHRILFEDADGQQKIEVVDASGDHSVVIDTANNSVSVTSAGDVSVEARGELRLSGERGVKVSSNGEVTVTGSLIKLN